MIEDCSFKTAKFGENIISIVSSNLERSSNIMVETACLRTFLKLYKSIIQVDQDSFFIMLIIDMRYY